jgi:hypothetical protein
MHPAGGAGDEFGNERKLVLEFGQTIGHVEGGAWQLRLRRSEEAAGFNRRNEIDGALEERLNQRSGLLLA